MSSCVTSSSQLSQEAIKKDHFRGHPGHVWRSVALVDGETETPVESRHTTLSRLVNG